MVSAKSIYDFLDKNQVTDYNRAMIKRYLRELEAEAWARGFDECLQCNKRRRMMAASRRKKFISRFLDHLSDLTHGK